MKKKTSSKGNFFTIKTYKLNMKRKRGNIYTKYSGTNDVTSNCKGIGAFYINYI